MNICFCIDSMSPNSSNELGDYLFDNLNPIIIDNRPVIFLCIGTDRSTGDSLGPLIGYKIKGLSGNKIYIYGSLESPVHAKNLQEIITKIYKTFKNPFLIAIDSSLGSVHNIGKVIIEDTPLVPGSALKKNLPSIGDICIKGIVNISTNFDFMILQNTRLYTVMELADCISDGIKHFIFKVNRTFYNADSNFLNIKKICTKHISF